MVFVWRATCILNEWPKQVGMLWMSISVVNQREAILFN